MKRGRGWGKTERVVFVFIILIVDKIVAVRLVAERHYTDPETVVEAWK